MPATKLLLVDDNSAILNSLAEMLASEFLIVGRLSSGAEVSQQAKDLVPDVIVLDVSLEDMNGFEVASELRAGGCPAKVIFLSCHEMPGFVRRAFELGARGYVYKSQMADLAKAIHIAAAGGVYSPINSSASGSDIAIP
jgi:DNA-binding NarL/FixJ family response regulator